jgi:hypothetical protein
MVKEKSMYRITHWKPALLGAALLLAALGPARAAEPAKPAEGKPIDVVICLDVSNSMDGLIGAAKLKLWDIVNDLGKVKPTPKLRVGLYSYGHTSYDRNAGWVRKDLDLTDDLDAVYQKLNGLTTRGGEEYVARVCRDAIEQQKWSAGKDALKVIFVCGNEPASQDPLVKLRTVGDLAVQKGIVINPIFCGPAQHRDARDWKEFATMAGGRFASIDHDRGTVAIATPQDKELAALSVKLNTTYLAYGHEGKDKASNQVAQDANALRASPQAAAARGVSKATALYRNDSWDLVDRCQRDAQFDVKKLPVDQLPESMKKMTPEQREKHVKEMLARREGLQKQINELNARRTAYVNEQMKKNPSQADKAFDEAVRGALCEQAARKGIVIPRDR